MQLDRALESVSHRVVELAEIVIATMTGSRGATWSYTSACCRCSRGRCRSPGDLRIVAALLQIIGCVVRMGDQCANIANLVPLPGCEAPKDKDILGTI